MLAVRGNFESMLEKADLVQQASISVWISSVITSVRASVRAAIRVSRVTL
jgi:hypothetical protein